MIRRFLLLPIYAVITIMHIGLTIVLKLSDWIFYVIGGLLMLTTALCFLFGLEGAAELKRMLLVSGVFFLIPLVVTMIDGVLEFAVEVIGTRLQN